MKRRDLLLGAAAATAAAGLARPAIAQGAARVFRMVPHANPGSLDPIWTTAYVTRNFGYLVWDTLYGTDSEFKVQPQMAEGHTVEDDGRRYVIRLREGLKFHDGEPVRAADCIASIERWSKRDSMGQWLAEVTDAMRALDDRRFEIRLKRPFSLLIPALGKPSSNVPVIMPERIAKTDPYKQVEEFVGSGPFRFNRDEWRPGDILSFARNEAYVPRPSGTPSLTAGPKVVHFDRLEWRIIPDPATASAALQAGEIDWLEQPSPDLMTLLRRNRNITVTTQDPVGLAGIVRFNHLIPPFDRAEMRRAILPAVNQADYMIAVNGTDPEGIRTGTGFFASVSPFATTEGVEVMKGDIEAGKAALKAAGYNGERVVIIAATDLNAPRAISEVTGDLFRRLGINVDYQAMDWGTVVQRRNSKEPLDKGGYNIICTAFGGYDFIDPAGHLPLRGNGERAWVGWPTMPRMEELRNAWFEAPDLAAQQAITREMQRLAFQQVPYLPVGEYIQFTAHRSSVQGMLKGIPVLWNIRKA